MRKQSFASQLRDTSMLALSAAAFLASSGTPASAQATKGIYAGGSSLAAQALRQIFDCYTGATVGGDGFVLPLNCTVVSTVQGMVANVESSNGIRGYIANSPQQWFGGTVPVPAMISPPPFPATPPPYIDSANPSNFGSYPYPRVDIGLSDSPLPATLAALITTSITFSPAINWLNVVAANGSAVVAYSTTVYGNPIQIPAFEVNVAVAVNTNSLTVNSAIAGSGTLPATQANQGAAIQLTEGQLCAIFSGLVTDWNSTAFIPYLDSAGVQQIAPFYYANVGNGIGTAVPYSATSLPITVVFRSDGSGTSFILTNYLKAVCPLLDPTDTYKYKMIFNASNLPNSSFGNLITNILAARGNGPWIPGTTVAGAWVHATGSSGVASGVSDSSGTKAGRIGYVSADFTRPYTTQVAGVGAPYSAALQSEQLRASGIHVPNTVSTNALTFIAPTPAAADAAWNDTRLQAPSNNYNIYGNTFTTTTTQGGVTLFGQPVLPLTNVVGAYPLSGTTFLDLYSCYNVQIDATRVTNLRNFLTWFFNSPAVVQSIVENNSFHLVPASYSASIITQYLTAGITAIRPNYIQAAAPIQQNGCTGVVGGASGGAK